MIIYIAGKMTGEPNWNAHEFNKAEVKLSFAGHTIFNMANVQPIYKPELVPHEAYMKIAFAIIDCCETICMLDGWEKSKGATMEYEYARKKGKGVIEYRTFEYLTNNRPDYSKP